QRRETLMSTLAYSQPTAAAVEPKALSPRRGFWHRVYAAIVKAQERRAEREIARYLESHGGLLTDDIERQMMERLSGRSRRPRCRNAGPAGLWAGRLPSNRRSWA